MSRQITVDEIKGRLKQATNLRWSVTDDSRCPGLQLSAMSGDHREFYQLVQVSDFQWRAYRGQHLLAVGRLPDVTHALAEREGRAVAPY